MVFTYANRLGLTAWRRKSTFLIAATLVVLFIFYLQYNRDYNSSETSTRNIQENVPLALASGEKSPVRFLDKLRNFNRASEDPKSPSIYLNGGDSITKVQLKNNIFPTEELRFDLGNSIEQLGIPYTNIDAKKPYIPRQRLVHFDLKGAPPKMTYLKQLLPIIKNLGATGILLEYEDMFPFNGNLADIAAKNAYTKTEIIEFLELAKVAKIEIIPLVQTFGHVEFALKGERFVGLREVPESPQALCPSRNQSLFLIRDMITQIMDVHEDVKYLHIGCDEVFQMGECEQCRGVMREILFLQHVKHVVQIVQEKWPKVKIIIWDDMLRHISQQTLEEMSVGSLVEPMVWVYAEDIYRFVQNQVWEKYAAVFPTVWTASAFKGAFGETLYMPNAKRHLENNLRWLEVMAQQSVNFKNGFAGIVITGWQRYDHFAVLCELLPAAIPSLAICLLATSQGYFNSSLRAPLLSALSCPQYTSSSMSNPFISLDTDPYLWDKFARCMFPGSPFFKLTYRLSNAELEANEYIESVSKHKGWMTDYNVRHNYSLPLRVDELTSDLPRVYHTMTTLARSAPDAMADIFDTYTISEWVEQRIYPYILTLEKIRNDSVALKVQKTWPKRPLPILKDLQRLGVN